MKELPDKNRQVCNIQRVAFIYLSLSNGAIDTFRVLHEMLMLRPKLGLAYLCAALKEKNIESQIYDQALINFNQKELIGLLQKNRVDLVGFYVCSGNLKNTVSFIQEIKKAITVPIIAGGPGYIHYNELIQAGCEIICLGEGDETIIDIVDYYEGRKRLEGINGIAYYDKKSGETLITPVRPLIDDLDKLPFPLRDSKTVKRYYDYFAYPLKKPYISIACSRGCPYRCAFCTSHLFWRGQYRQRSAESVIDEIREAVFKFGVKSILFIDDVFALSFNWLREFCRALKREKFDLRWMCNLLPSTFKERKKDAFLMMAESGCKLVSFGGQSANAEVLRNINRDPDEPEELKRSIHLAKKMNMTTAVTYIFGLPGDTNETLQQNLKFCIEAKPHIVDFHPLVILPNSEIALKYKDKSFCKLDEKEIKQLCKRYMVEYYTKPEVIFQLLKDILDKNPAWFFHIMRVGPKFLIEKDKIRSF